jgi:hypothetical protein
VGGEHSENPPLFLGWYKSRRDAWNSFLADPRRSDVVIPSKSEYNETYAASEVSWIIVSLLFFSKREKDPPNTKIGAGLA